MRNCLYELYSVDAEYGHVENNGLIEAVSEKKCALCGLILHPNCPVNYVQNASSAQTVALDWRTSKNSSLYHF